MSMMLPMKNESDSPAAPPDGIGEDTLASFNPAKLLVSVFAEELERSQTDQDRASSEWDLREALQEEQIRRSRSSARKTADSIFRPSATRGALPIPPTPTPASLETVSPSKKPEPDIFADDGDEEPISPGSRSGPMQPDGKPISEGGLLRASIDSLAATKMPMPLEPFLKAPQPRKSGFEGQKSDFQFIRKIGEGGFGEVWEAHQQSLRRSVAIKRLKFDKRDGRQEATETTRAVMTETFRCEALTTATLDHPNIVPIHDIGMDDQGRPLIAMKLVRGMPWNKMIEADFAVMNETDFLNKHIPILIQAAQAIAFAHSRGLIHRDIKPAQVMVGEFDEVMVMDWGLSVAVDEMALEQHKGISMAGVAPNLITASNPAGTVAYMAPEQTHPAAGSLGPWTDVYLLGATLYHLLTGKTPHQGKMTKAYAQASTGFIVPFSESAPEREVPKDLIALVELATRPDFRERNLTAREFVQHLKDFLGGASNRAESEEMTNAIRKRLDDSKGKLGYSGYAEAVSRLRHAQGLWAKNPALADLEAILYGGYAMAALDTGDLSLAQMLVMQMPRGEERTNLAEKISTRIREVGKHRRQREALFASVIVFAILSICGTIYFWNKLARVTAERDAAISGKVDDAR
jgi:serine/threonine protein kinase